MEKADSITLVLPSVCPSKVLASAQTPFAVPSSGSAEVPGAVTALIGNRGDHLFFPDIPVERLSH
jgi:hypothetical protein